MALATLDNTTKKLQVILGGSVATNECPITAGFADVRKDSLAGGNESQSVFKSDDAITTGASAVDVVDPPPTGVRRRITDLSVYNADTTSVTVTVRLYVDASTTRVLFKATLQTLENLYYSESMGFYAVDVNGNMKTNTPASSGAASTADSKAVLASSQASSIQLSVVATSSQASSITLLTPASISSQASSLAAGIVVASVNSVSSQASSLTAQNPNTVSSLQSAASVQSFTSTTWSTVSSATSRTKSSFSW